MAISVEVKHLFFLLGEEMASWVSKHEMCLVDGGTYSLLPTVRKCLQQPQPVMHLPRVVALRVAILALRKKKASKFWLG